MRLIDLEGDTNFTLQNQSAVKGQKLGLCLQSLIFLSPRRVSPFLAWGDFHARSRFARSSIPEETQGTIRSLIIYIYSRKLKRFFLRRQDTPYQPEYSQVTNLAASGVTSPLVSLKRIVGVVQDSNSRHDQLEYFQTTFGKCTSSSLR